MKRSLFFAKRKVMCPREITSFAALTANGRLSADELAELNWQRRRDIVRYVFENNSFYKNKYTAAGFELGDLKTPADFARLPILEKEEIRKNTQEMISVGYSADRLKSSATGGSTGAPLTVYQDPAAPRNEISWRMLNWWGCDISDSSAYLYRAIPSARNQLIQKTILWPTRRNWIAASEMDEGLMNQFYQKLLRDKPTYLIGYVGALDVFAGYLERNALILPSLKAVWTTAAPLPEGKRNYMEAVYKAPVYTQYGSCELYWVAAECSLKKGMHVGTDVRHVDVVDAENNPVATGVHGDLVISNLTNRAFPLIRYRLGDRGRLLEKPCACGMPFPLMDYVDGRVSEKVYLPSGMSIPGEALAGIFRGFPHEIKSYQIRQRADFSINIRYETLSGSECSEAIAELKKVVDKRLRGEVNIQFEKGPVDVNDNGKTRFLISEVEHAG